ncbi:hypothetical protein PHMEG_00011699 [Phytophthora megakarya]|uniref:Uncharacterized protein n=1 Tax=Phytophthora megakarya TaxID=4795 RepID=A0A225WD62_9STRA|nr:hypothetical protein PHMEG_00011699 [Phytophthora megakarya]
MKDPRRQNHYTVEQRREALERVSVDGCKPTARALNIPLGTLKGWRKKTKLLFGLKGAQTSRTTNGQGAKRKITFERDLVTFMKDICLEDESQSFVVLDKIAEAILEGKAKEAMEEFGTPVLLLPHPARMTALKQAPDHPIFADHKRDSPPLSRYSSEKVLLGRLPKTHHPKDSTPKGKPEKNTLKDSSLKGATANTLFPHPLVDKTKAKVKNVLEEIYRTVQEAKKSVYELAYPWEGSFFASPSLHLAYWRIWMRNRPKFFDWQLHALLFGKYIMGVMRKAKMDAIQERVELLDMCVTT